MTSATIGKWEISHAGTSIEEVLSVSGLGRTNQLLDVTNFDSPAGSMEYIAGLADGDEVTIECNYLSAAPGQGGLRDDVDAGDSASFKLTYNNAVTFTFTAACIGYTIIPSVTEQNKVSYTIKISGNIVEGTPP